MKDYSKVKYVKPSVDAFSDYPFIKKNRYLTKGKIYKLSQPVVELFSIFTNIIDDIGSEISIVMVGYCGHLKDGHWTPCDKDGNEIEI